MNEKYYLSWKGGEIEIDALGCKMIPIFNLNGKKIKPFHEPDWLNDNSDDFNSLPGILQNLKGEFPCVPFGINSPIDDITDEWKESYSVEPYIVNEAHGYSSNKNWELIEKKSNKLDPFEHLKVSKAVKELNLNHVVITSVDRDDLKDGGSEHFKKVILETKKQNPSTTIEVLTPDFLRKGNAFEKILDANPHVFNHNIETVPSLYLTVRPGSRYYSSIKLLDTVKKNKPTIFTKSGLMVGMGETKEEILQVMDDLRSADVDFLTIGQYLQPSSKHYPLQRYYHPDEFKELKNIALSKGFLLVASSPLTRSSYHADEDFKKLKSRRDEQIKCQPHQ